MLSVVFSRFRLVTFRGLFPPRGGHRRIRVLRDLILPVPRPATLLLYGLFVVYGGLLRYVAARVIIRGTKDGGGFLGRDASNPVARRR